MAHYANKETEGMQALLKTQRERAIHAGIVLRRAVAAMTEKAMLELPGHQLASMSLEINNAEKNFHLAIRELNVNFPSEGDKIMRQHNRSAVMQQDYDATKRFSSSAFAEQEMKKSMMERLALKGDGTSKDYSPRDWKKSKVSFNKRNGRYECTCWSDGQNCCIHIIDWFNSGKDSIWLAGIRPNQDVSVHGLEICIPVAGGMVSIPHRVSCYTVDKITGEEEDKSKRIYVVEEKDSYLWGETWLYEGETLKKIISIIEDWVTATPEFKSSIVSANEVKIPCDHKRHPFNDFKGYKYADASRHDTLKMGNVLSFKQTGFCIACNIRSDFSKDIPEV